MPASIAGHGQSTLPDGRVLTAGGSGACYIYNPSSNTWSVAASLPDSFYASGQSTFIDGRVMVSGGQNSRAIYIYNPSINAWTTGASLPITIDRHAQSTLNDGRVFVSGGSISASDGFKTSFIYTPNSGLGTWIEASPMPTGLRNHGQSTLIDGRILISGGYTVTGWIGACNTTYFYVPDSTWSPPVATLPAVIGWHRQSTLADGKVLISGGGATGNTNLNTSYIYTPNATWASIANLPVGLNQHNQSTLADGRVLVSGGYDGVKTLNTTYIYTPTGWVAVGSGNLSNIYNFF